MTNRVGIDIGYFLRKIGAGWMLIISSLVIALMLALLAIYFLPKEYKVTASLKVDDGSNSAIAESLFDGVKVVQEKMNTSNEVAILKSFELLRSTLEINYYKASYFRKNNFRSEEVFTDRPFSVVVDSSINQIIHTPIQIKFINDERYVLTVDEDDVELFDYSNGATTGLSQFIEEVSINDTLKFDEYIETPFLKLKLTKNSDFDITDEFYFVLEDINILAEDYSKRLNITPISKDASILKLSIDSAVPEREIIFLNQLINLYVQRNVNNKNRVAQNILDFIDNQLSDIADSLHTAEMDLQNFRSLNKVIDIDEESKSIFEELKSLEKQKAEELIKFKYYDYLNQYVKKNGTLNDIIAPSVMGIQDLTLNELISKLSGFEAQRTAISYSAKEGNPKYNIIQENIENTRLAILENVRNIRISSQIKLNDIQQRLTNVQQQVQQLPENERVMLNVQRKFEFNDNIYNYFLEKRGEAAIIKESNIPFEVVIDHARVEGKDPVSPNKKLILIVMIILGFVVPIGFIFIKDVVSTKILNEGDVVSELNPAYPLLGEIPRNNKRKSKTLAQLDKLCYESFRSLKLKIESNSKQKIIALTSLIKGDGKTFCSLHLAKAFSLSGKRVLLIDLNFENPMLTKQAQSLESENVIRTINWAGWFAEIVKTTTPGLQLLSLNNDATKSINDLINQERFSSLFEEISPLYDYIIIDCPALNQSANFLAINDLTHLNLIVVRRKHTPSDLSSFQNLANSHLSSYRYLFNCW